MQFGLESVWAKLRAKVEAARAPKEATKRLYDAPVPCSVPSRASEVFETPDDVPGITETPPIGTSTVEGPPVFVKSPSPKARLGLVTDAGPAHYDSRAPYISTSCR